MVMSRLKTPNFEDLLKKVEEPKAPAVSANVTLDQKQAGEIGYTLAGGWKLQNTGQGISLLSPRGNVFNVNKINPGGKVSGFTALKDGKPVKIPPFPPPEPIDESVRQQLKDFEVKRGNINPISGTVTGTTPFQGELELPEAAQIEADIQSRNIAIAEGKAFYSSLLRGEEVSVAGFDPADIKPKVPSFGERLETVTGGMIKADDAAGARFQERAGQLPGIAGWANRPTALFNLTPAEIVGIAAIVTGGVQVIKSLTEFGRQPQVKVVSQVAKAAQKAGKPLDPQTVQDAKDALRTAYNLQKMGASEAANEILTKFNQAYTKAFGGVGTTTEASTAVRQVIAKYEPSIPKGTQTGAMAFGGLPGKPTKELGQRIAGELGITFDGIQKGTANIPDKMQFTDTVTGSTTYGNTLEEVKTNIENMRAKFESAKTPSGNTAQNVPALKLPEDVIKAVKGTPGAEIKPEGLKLVISRYQTPEQAGKPSVRGGVFYMPEAKSRYQRYYTTGKIGYGGKQRIQGEVTITNPIVAKGASGGKVPERVYNILKGKGAYEKMRSDVLQNALSSPYKNISQSEQIEKIKTLLEKYGGHSELAGDILKYSNKGNQLAYAIQENIVAATVEKAGYDAILGYNVVKDEYRLSEVMLVKSRNYPDLQTFIAKPSTSAGTPLASPTIAPLHNALIQDGEQLVTQAEKIAPDDPNLARLKSALETAKSATNNQARADALRRMEQIEPAVKKITESPMSPSTSVQTGLQGMGKEAAQARMFGEVSGKGSRKVPLTQAPVKGTALEGQTPLGITAQESEQAQANLDFLKQAIKNDSVTNYKFKMGNRNVGLESLISIKEQSFPEYLTVKQAQALNPEKSFAHYAVKGTKDYNKVPKDAALDQLTKEFGMTPDEIAQRVEQIRAERAQLRRLQTLAGMEVQPEAPTPEVVVSGQPPAHPVPPQSVIPPAPQPSFPDMPKDSEIKRIIAQSEEQIRQNAPTALTRLAQKIPFIKSIIEFERPGLKMTGDKQRVLTALVAENAARSDVSVWAMGTRLKLLKELRDVFGKDVLRGGKSDIKFVGAEEQTKNPITGTLKDIADNPELYELSGKELSALVSIEIHNNMLLAHVVENYGAEIGRFTPKENGAFLPNVDISEDVVEYLGSETRAVAQGRGKTRIWSTARDRMNGKTPFKPELDVQKLIEGLDTFKSSAAGGQTYKTAIGGLTKLEVIKETHPNLYKKMGALRKELNSLRGSAGTIEGNLHTTIDDFLKSPIEDADILNLKDNLDVKLKAGKRKGLDMSAVQDKITAIQDQIDALRPAWKAANLKPYTFVQEGIYRYFPGETAKTIIESRAVTKNRALGFIEKVRGQAFSGDLSPFAIQGSIGVLADPFGSVKAAVGGIAKAIEAKDILRSVKIEALADDISNNAQEWGQFASLMGKGLSGTPKEYSAGFLSMIPGFDKFTENTYVSVTRGSFNLWQRLYKQMMKAGVPELEAKVAAIKSASEIYPMVNSSLLGQSKARESVLRALPTSYSFIRQPATLIADGTRGFAKFAVHKKLTPQESSAVKLLITMAASVLTIAATSAAISAKSQGKSDDEVKKAIWDAVNPNPYNGKFASIIVGNVRIPIGGPYRALFRAIYPSEIKGIPFPVPFAGIGTFLKNRITPAIGTQLDLIVNKDYSGTPIIKGNFPENLLRGLEYEFENFVPLTVGTVAESIRQGDKYREPLWQNVIGQFMGVNPVTLDNTYIDRQLKQIGQLKQTGNPYEKQQVYDVRDAWGDVTSVLNKRTGKGYDDKPQTKAILEAIPIKETTDKLSLTPLTGVDMDKLKYRQSILGDKEALAAFDKDNPALSGIGHQEYNLLLKYQSLKDQKSKATFLKENPELTLSPRKEWLKDHPEENAKLAVWGQAELLTPEAYDMAWKMASDLKLPDSAVIDFLTDSPSYLKDTLKPDQLKAWTKDRLGETDLLSQYDLESIGESDLVKNKMRDDNPDLNVALVLAGRSSVLSSLRAATDTANEARKFGISLETIPAFSKTDKGKERIPSDQKFWKPYFDYNDLPGSSYLAMSQDQVDAGLLPEKYLKEWQTYHSLKTDTAKDYFRKAHKEVSKGDWRDDFRRANPEFDKWLQENQGIQPLKRKTIASRRSSGGVSVARPSFGGIGSSSIRRPSGKPSYPKFKKVRVSGGISVRAPRAPGV